MDATTQIAEVLKCLQAATTLYRQIGQRRSQKIAESLAIASSHTTTHLVEIRESEAMGPIDDNRIGIRNIDTILYDGGRE